MVSEPTSSSAVPPIWPRLARWLPAGVWAGVIFWGSSQPGSAVPSRFAVIGHLAEYAVLGALLAVALRERHRHGLLAAAALAIAAASAYGITDELHQVFVPGRVADPADWAIDTAGAVLGVALAFLVYRLHDARREVPRSS